MHHAKAKTQVLICSKPAAAFDNDSNSGTTVVSQTLSTCWSVHQVFVQLKSFNNIALFTKNS